MSIENTELIITQELLKEFVKYDPDTGIFYKIKKKHVRDNTRPLGSVVGHKSGDGYIHFAFFGKKRKAHRMAWLYMTGNLPFGVIDHIDGDKTNNKFSNLRDVTQSENLANMHKIVSRTGFRGVYENIKNGIVVSYLAQYNKKHLGAFKTPEEASARVDSYLLELFGDKAKTANGVKYE